MEIATEMAASKPLRQSGTVSKPVRKPVETSSVHDTGDDDEELEDDEDSLEASGGKNSVIWCSMLRKFFFLGNVDFQDYLRNWNNKNSQFKKKQTGIQSSSIKFFKQQWSLTS